MRARAAVMRAPGRPLAVEELELAPPAAGEILVRIVAAGVCGSDRHFLDGDAPIRTPVVLGHEGAGVVEAVGPGVTRVAVGDHVLQSPIAYCRRCRQCSRGRLTHCEAGFGVRDGSMLDGTFRLRRDGEEVGAASRLGSFSEYSVCPEGACTVIPSDVDLEVAAVVACGIATGLGAALNAARIQPGQHAVVFGVGGVGIAALLGAVAAGAAEVIAVDLHAAKLERAREFGATRTVLASEDDVVAAVGEATGGVGADHAILCIDTVRAQHIALAFDAVGPGGTVVLVGLADRADGSIPIAPNALIRGQKTLTGTYLGGMNVPGDVLRYLDLYRAGRLPLDRIVTRTYALDDIGEAFDDLASGVNLRGVVLP